MTDDLAHIALDYLYQAADYLVAACFAVFVILKYYTLEKREVNR